VVWFFSRDRLYLVFFLLLPVIYFFSLPNSIGDLAVWIAHGNYLLQHHEILRHDIFSVLPTQEMIYSVGSSLVYGIIYQLSGLDNVTVFHKMVILFICVLWYRSSLKNLQSPWSLKNGFFILLTWVGCSLLCIDRPALLAMLPFVLSYLVLQKEEKLSTKDIIYLNLINILWVNTHGSWMILGLMYFWREAGRIVFFKEKISLKPVIGLFSIALSSFVNPFGYQVIPYAFETAQVSKERGISEWLLLNPVENLLQFCVFSALFSIFVIYFLRLRKSDLARSYFLLASPFTFLLLLGLTGIRHTAWSFFVLLPFAFQVGWLQEGTIPATKPNGLQASINFILILGLIILTFLFFPQNKEKIADYLPQSKRIVYDESAPFQFAKILSEEPGNDPVFNDWEYGGFLILAQPHPIFIDTRNIIYDQGAFQTYLNVVEALPGWQDILNQYKIKYIILNKKIRQPLIQLIQKKAEWKMLAEDEFTILYAR